MEIRLIINAEPMGKERPKFARRGGFVTTYTPEKTSNYQDMVRKIFKQQYPDAKEGNTVLGDKPLSMEIYSYFKIPKAYSKTKHQDAVNGIIRPTVKPDFDNLAKIIADSLNGLAYDDDKQIVDAIQHKFYSEEPHSEVIIKTIGE